MYIGIKKRLICHGIYRDVNKPQGNVLEHEASQSHSIEAGEKMALFMP